MVRYLRYALRGLIARIILADLNACVAKPGLSAFDSYQAVK
jgi:hypothetical protein